MKQLPLIEWMFGFEPTENSSGGWNTVYAKTKKGAITAALKEYKDDDYLNPNTNSFNRVDKNPKTYKALLSLFY